MAALRQLLEKAIEMLDDGDCDHITSEELEMLSAIINKPKCLNLTEAYRYLGISRTRFYELREAGIIKEPTCRAGSKEKMYSAKMLDEVKRKID